MNHFKSEIYSKIWWKHVPEGVGSHANSDHHKPPHTCRIVR